MPTFETLQSIFQHALNGDVLAVFFWIACLVAIACVGSAFYQLGIRRWPSVNGQLLNAAAEKFGATDFVAADQDYIIRLSYEYVVDGETYIGHRLSPTQMTASGAGKMILDYVLLRLADEDGQVAVYYNPRNPRKSFLKKPGLASGLFTLFMGGGAVAVAFETWSRLVG